MTPDSMTELLRGFIGGLMCGVMLGTMIGVMAIELRERRKTKMTTGPRALPLSQRSDNDAGLM